MKTIKLRLRSLCNEEKEIMVKQLKFLFDPKSKSKDTIIKLADKLYGGDTRFEFILDNGHSPVADNATTYMKDKHYYTLVRFEAKHMTSEALDFFGHSDDWDFRYYYGLSVCKEDRKLYIVSFKDRCCPNWNNEYRIQRAMSLDMLNIPILDKKGTIYGMCNSLHIALNEKIWKKKPLLIEEEGKVSMAVKDQHGNYCYIQGADIESVFRDYADNYTGYRSYRNQMASEWEIVDKATELRYAEWQQTAKGLKSDFDKFYDGGIVD